MALSKFTILANLWEFLVVLVAFTNAYLYPPSIMVSNPSFSRPLNAVVDSVNLLDFFFRLFVIFHPDGSYQSQQSFSSSSSVLRNYIVS
jgi:hypothetical protein